MIYFSFFFKFIFLSFYCHTIYTITACFPKFIKVLQLGRSISSTAAEEQKYENTTWGFKTMSSQAVHLLPAVYSGEQRGTGGPPGCPICRGRGPPAPRRRPSRSAGWRWDPGNGGPGIPHLPGQEPGDPATPSPRLPASPPLGTFPQQLPSRPVLKIPLYQYSSPPTQMNYAAAWRERGGTPPISKGPLFGSHVIPTDNASHACFLPRK